MDEPNLGCYFQAHSRYKNSKGKETQQAEESQVKGFSAHRKVEFQQLLKAQIVLPGS